MSNFVRDAAKHDLTAEFFSTKFEQSEFFLPGSALGQELKKILNLDTFEELLWLIFRLRPSAIQITRNSLLLTDGEKSRIDIARHLHRLLDDGYSLVINFAEEFNSKLAVFAREFGDEFSSPFHISLFLTPPSTTAFNAHFDAIDVFAVQVSGDKTWEIGRETTYLPGHSYTHTTGPEPEMRAKYELTSGDLLYVPRGLIHRVSGSKRDLSLHASFALESVRIGTLLREAIAFVEDGDLNLRRADLALMSAIKRGEEGFSSDLTAVLGNLCNQYILKSSRAHIAAKNCSSLPQPPGRLKRYGIGHDEISGDTKLCRRRGMPCEVLFLRRRGLAAISFPGLAAGRPYKEDALLTFPGQYIALLDYIRDNTDPFTPESFPGKLSTGSKVVVARRLIKEGLLERVVAEENT